MENGNHSENEEKQVIDTQGVFEPFGLEKKSEDNCTNKEESKGEVKIRVKREGSNNVDNVVSNMEGIVENSESNTNSG